MEKALREPGREAAVLYALWFSADWNRSSLVGSVGRWDEAADNRLVMPRQRLGLPSKASRRDRGHPSPHSWGMVRPGWGFCCCKVSYYKFWTAPPSARERWGGAVLPHCIPGGATCLHSTNVWAPWLQIARGSFLCRTFAPVEQVHMESSPCLPPGR